MDRREFVKITAATGASATLAGCGNPENQLIRFVPEEQLIPGQSVIKPSVCPLCSAGCGLHVRVMEGDAEVVRDGKIGVMTKGLAKKLEGHPYHPVNQGKLCVRGQAAIQVTYHPDRIRQPLKRVGERGAGQFEPISWEKALNELVAQLNGLVTADKQRNLGFLSRPLTGGRSDLIEEFIGRFGASPGMTFEVFGDEVLRKANALSFGFEQLPTFDLGRSNYIISFGADFLGTWNSPVAQNVAYGEMRKGRPGSRGKFVQVEARMSQTGSNADEWIPVRTGTDGVLALGIAHLMFVDGGASPSDAGQAGELIEGWSDGLKDYAPERVESITGVDRQVVARLARELFENVPGVALIGGAPLAQTNGLFHAVAVNALNALMGNIQKPGGVFFTPTLRTAGNVSQNRASIRKNLERILQPGDSPIQVLLLNDANPVFGAPPAWGFLDAFLKIPYIASFGSFIDETSNLADLILPDHSFLESWIDSVPESGTIKAVESLAPPAMRPLYETRSMPDVLLEVGKMLDKTMDPPLPWDNYQELLRERVTAISVSEGSPNDLETVGKEGGWWKELPLEQPGDRPLGQDSLSFKEAEFDGDGEEYPYHFLPFVSQAFLDGSLAHLPWLQELPDVLSSAMWSSWVEINHSTALGLGIVQGDLIEIASSQGVVYVPAFVSPAIAPDVIAMPVGQGHDEYTRYASGRGANPISILAPVEESETGALAWAATKVRISKVDNTSDLILFGGALREHPEHSR